MNHLTKTNSKLSPQIHKVMPRPWASFYTLMARSVHSGNQEVRVFLMPQLRKLAQSGSLLHSGLRHPPPPPHTQLYFLLYFLSPQLEDNWKQEKKIWGEEEKARWKAESDLKITTDHLHEMELSTSRRWWESTQSFLWPAAVLATRSTSWTALCSEPCVLNTLPQHPLCARHCARHGGSRRQE